MEVVEEELCVIAEEMEEFLENYVRDLFCFRMPARFFALCVLWVQILF